MSDVTLTEDDVLIMVLEYVERGNLSPALTIEACKCLELRRISQQLKQIADYGINTYPHE